MMGSRVEASGVVPPAVSYGARVEERACLHARPGLPADLAWVEWPCPDGAAIHALARRKHGRWRTTLIRAERGQGPEDVLRLLRLARPGAGLPRPVDLPSADAARIVFGAVCGDLAGLLGLALRGSGIPADARAVREAEAWHAGEIAPLAELLHGADVLDAFGDCAAGRILPAAVDLLTAGGDAARRLRDLRRSHPMVARLALSSTLVVGALSAGADLHGALSLPCPGYTPAHLRRAAGATLAGVGAQVPLSGDVMPDDREVLGHARAALRLAAALPADWMPRGDGAWIAFATVAGVLAAGPGLGAASLRRSKGDWTALVDRLARGAGVVGGPPRRVSAALRAAAERLQEPRQALLRQVLVPLCANAAYRLGHPGSGPDPEFCAERAQSAADALLWGDKDVGACLALGREWAGMRDRIDRGVADVAAAGGAAIRWEPLGPAWRHAGVEVRPIVDALSLWEEGASTPDRDGVDGLDHCVYGRLRLFRAGTAHGLSLRAAGGGPRLSTAQVAFQGGRPALVEHRGPRNADPAPEAHEALASYFAALVSGALGPLPEPRSPGRLDDALWDMCGFDWRRAESVGRALEAWAPLLPRWLRGLDAGEAFDLLVGRGLLDPVP